MPCLPWQKGKIEFARFFRNFHSILVNWLIPAFAMNLAIGRDAPQAVEEHFAMKTGAKRIMVLFLITITTAVVFHNYLHLPPAAGMMLGLCKHNFNV